MDNSYNNSRDGRDNSAFHYVERVFLSTIKGLRRGSGQHSRVSNVETRATAWSRRPRCNITNTSVSMPPKDKIAVSSHQLAILLRGIVEATIRETEFSSPSMLTPGAYSRIKGDIIHLSRDELKAILLRVEQGAKDSVSKGTKVPTGVCLQNFGSRQCCLDLFWGNTDTRNDVTVRYS